MADTDRITTTDDAALQRAENTLDAQIRLCTSSADAAVKQALRQPGATALARVDHTIGLLRTLQVEAKRLQERGRGAAHQRLKAIIDDLTAARATMAKTLGALVAADRTDTAGLADARTGSNQRGRELLDERLDQAQDQASAINNLL